jgi:cob(I)alamin adenosyltransferase
MLGVMKIYTRTGDAGETGLFGGVRVPKDDPRVDAYGTVDELNSTLGMARAEQLSAVNDELLARVQSDLFAIGAELACAPGKQNKLRTTLIDAADITRLEQAIDAAETDLKALENFVLPGGTRGAAALHFARTVCRRAERLVLGAGRLVPLRSELIVYLNRLSDLLFVLARHANHEAGVADMPWENR